MTPPSPRASLWTLRAVVHVVPPALIGLALFGLRQSAWQEPSAQAHAAEPSLWMTVVLASPPGFLVYAATSFFLRVWPRRSIGAKAMWISVAPTLAVGVEVGQAAGLLPGTFGPLDLMTSVVGTCLALIAGTWSRESDAPLQQVSSSLSE